jgi:YD repeat-containing protein
MIGFTSKKLSLALLATSALTTPALAQQEGTPPPREFVDQNGVDLASGALSIEEPTVSIGTAQQGLTFHRHSNRLYNTFTYSVFWAGGSYPVTVVAQERTIMFNPVGGVFVNQQGTGETLSQSGSGWTFTERDGTVVQLDLSQVTVVADRYNYLGGTSAIANTVTSPNGAKWVLTYRYVTRFNAITEETIARIRLQAVQSSNGYMAKFEYQENVNWNNFNRLTNATLINSAVDYCNPSADSCTFSQSWPALTYVTSGGNTIITISDSLGRTTRYTLNPGLTQLAAIKRPTSASTDNTTIAYGIDGRVSSVTTDGRTWNYAWSLSGTQLTSTTTNPDSTQRVVVSDTNLGQPISDRDELNRTTSFTSDTNGRITDITFPEGNKRHYVYDSRGNLTEARAIAKTGSGLPDIVLSASYDATCTNPVKCNKPNSTTDARGNVTDYMYDSTHGGLLTVTRPAPTTGATRPQTRYGYTALQAYYKNSSGSIVASGQPTDMLTSTSACQTTSSCSGLADEVKTAISYGPQSAGTANNLLPVSSSSGSGDGALTATTAVTYDNIGNATNLDGPLSGAADTTRTLYDADREVIGQISPDPDGAGSLPNRAIRLTYNADGQVTKTENGTTAGQSDSAWAAFSPADYVDTAYDASGRVSTQTLKNGSASYALTQNSYDSLGRLDCSAVRMNPSIYSSLPSSACTLGTSGSYGPDRISQIVYDAASEPTQLKVAVGTSDAANERTLTYSSNGLAQTLTDGENNKTTYVYDGFDRLSQTQYPSTTKGSGTSNSSDYEQLGYDAASNVTSFRNRAGNSTGFTTTTSTGRRSKTAPEPSRTSLTGTMISAG